MIVLLLAVGVLVLALLALFFIYGERGRFNRSTWAFLRESGLHLRTFHGYIYSRWTQKYIAALRKGIGGSPSATPGEFWLARHYHGKVLSHEHARSIIQLDKPIERRNLDKIVPFPVARDLILKAPPDIVAYECVCRNGMEKHCEPTQVCMIVGKPFTDFAIEHHPDKARRLSRAEALDLLEAEHARGHVHSAWFKDAMMNRFYAICNCCKCCCGGLYEMRERGVRMVASSGYVPSFQQDTCAVCGDCEKACPFNAITQKDDRVVHDWDACMGCGVCEVTCNTGSIAMVRDERKGIPLDVRAMA